MTLTRRHYLIGLPIVLGLGAGLVGPFGTYVYAPLLPRMLYWVVTLCMGYTLWWVLGTLGKKFIPEWPYEWDGLVIAIPFSILNPAI